MSTTAACNCIGPQNGQPLCPCQMRGLVEVDGQWVRPSQTIGPVRPKAREWTQCKCGTQIGPTQKFCHECGGKQEPTHD